MQTEARYESGKTLYSYVEAERDTYFIEKDPPVNFPVSGSRNANFRQHSVGKPTSYLMPTIFINSCS